MQESAAPPTGSANSPSCIANRPRSLHLAQIVSLESSEPNPGMAASTVQGAGSVNLGWLFLLGTACISAGVSYLCPALRTGAVEPQPERTAARQGTAGSRGGP